MASQGPAVERPRPLAPEGHSDEVGALRRLLCREGRKVERDPEARLIVQFMPPDMRHRDLHNMMQALKPAIDGIADAMGCDDRGFRIRWPEEFGPPIRHGRVLIEIRRQTEGVARGDYAALRNEIMPEARGCLGHNHHEE